MSVLPILDSGALKASLSWALGTPRMFIPAFSLVVFFIIGVILFKFIAGSARKEDSIKYASERLRKTLLITFSILISLVFTALLLNMFFGFVFPIDIGPDSLLSLFFIFITITVFVFTWGLRSVRGKTKEEQTNSERYKARFFVNLALHDFLLLGFTFFGYFDSSNFIYKSLALFSIMWSLLIFVYLMEFVVHFANLEKYVYEDLLKRY